MPKILAIDPGNTQSGVAILEMPNFRLEWFAKLPNEDVVKVAKRYDFDEVAIEMVACYGMPVGKDVFETCLWIGRFIEQLKEHKISFVYRKEEKIHLCGSMKAKDSNIKQALVNRYAKHDFKSGKGTKKNPDTFYGVAKDVWQAVAVGVTHYEKECAKNE
jgi:Holliday junction resolvasome RuvABC endonuclease subunit